MRVREPITGRATPHFPFLWLLVVSAALACVGCGRDGGGTGKTGGGRGTDTGAFSISIKEGQQTMVGSTRVECDELERLLFQELREHGNRMPVLLDVAETLPFRDLAGVLGVIERAGLYRLLFPAVRSDRRMLLTLELPATDDLLDRILITVVGRTSEHGGSARRPFEGKYKYRWLYGSPPPHASQGNGDETITYQVLKQRLAEASKCATGREVHVYIHAEPWASVGDFLDVVYAVELGGGKSARWERHDHAMPPRPNNHQQALPPVTDKRRKPLSPKNSVRDE